MMLKAKCDNEIKELEEFLRVYIDTGSETAKKTIARVTGKIEAYRQVLLELGKPVLFENLPEKEQVKYFDIVSSHLRDTYACSRVWEAWGYGTMTEEDFSLACDDDDIICGISKEFYESTNSL